MAVTGVDQVFPIFQKQGLVAAWMALDPNGENAAQAHNFLRSDAVLLVVVVSDGDDCLTVNATLSLHKLLECPCLADKQGYQGEGICNPDSLGSLLPTPDFFNKLKSVKPSAKVGFVAVVPDMILFMDLWRLHRRIPSLVVNVSSECACSGNSTANQVHVYACVGPHGIGYDVAYRCRQVTDALCSGAGLVVNICGDNSVTTALHKVFASFFRRTRCPYGRWCRGVVGLPYIAF